MVYLVKLLENKFNIVFNEKHFDRKSFYTIEGISDAIVNSYR